MVVVLVAVVAAGAAVVACGKSHAAGGAAPVSLDIVGQRYQAAIAPASAAISAVVARALSYNGGSTVVLDAAVAPAVPTLKTAAHELGGIAAPAPIHQDILNVATSVTVVVGDLTSLDAARGSAVEADIAQLVADAGRVSASDDVVRVTLTLLTSPTTELPVAEVPTTLAPTTTAPTTTTTLESTTTVARPTTTTVPRTTTTRPQATTTVPAVTTTVRATTTTTIKHTTTTGLLGL